MNVKINSVHFDADQKLKDFITNKLSKLTVYYDQIHTADVFLRLSNTQETSNKITEIKLKIPGSDFFVKKNSETFEESTDVAVEALRRQIKKHKEKIRGV